LARSSSSTSAWAISSSVTVTSSSTNARAWANVSGDGDLTAIPSAMVAMRASVTGRPASKLATIEAAPAASTPTTFTPRRWRASAPAMPAISPPPPTATTTASASRSSSASSSPIVPCPAITWRSSNGGTNAAPRVSASSLAAAMQSSTASPEKRISAP
jgi:hypothetical protein